MSDRPNLFMLLTNKNKCHYKPFRLKGAKKNPFCVKIILQSTTLRIMYSLKQVSLLDQTLQRMAGAVFLAQKWKNDAVSVQRVYVQEKEDIILSMP